MWYVKHTYFLFLNIINENKDDAEIKSNDGKYTAQDLWNNWYNTGPTLKTNYVSRYLEDTGTFSNSKFLRVELFFNS